MLQVPDMSSPALKEACNARNLFTTVEFSNVWRYSAAFQVESIHETMDLVVLKWAYQRVYGIPVGSNTAC